MKTVIEAALGRPSLTLVVLVAILPLACWAWVVTMARDMYGPMTGASAWMMTMVWDGPHVVLLWAMWAVMMTGMMLPSASPLVLLYGAATRRSRHETATAPRRIYALTAGYLFIWALFSIAATALQRGFSALLLLSPMMEGASTRFSAALLLLAGLYQLTPIKLACLRACQSPLGFLMSRWRGGVSGAFRMGLAHGAYCVGCCWALMLLLFAGGVMNLAVIAALTALVAFEKLAPFGRHAARVTGMLLIAGGLWMLVR